MRGRVLSRTGDDPLTPEDIAALAKGMAPIIKEYIEKALAPLEHRMATFERERGLEKRIEALERKANEQRTPSVT